MYRERYFRKVGDQRKRLFSREKPKNYAIIDSEGVERRVTSGELFEDFGIERANADFLTADSRAVCLYEKGESAIWVGYPSGSTGKLYDGKMRTK
ncbi:hypothetical protein APU90_08460 [Rathayibacter toxicus]|nr:hypothetical protein APU90_08460 [Rathayibacter toxicus]PPI22194.1 hypothetical protein C5D55_08475 [Rathayibacter toxicus]PPI53922.1 hypothetical protein C5D35_08550 [Rathayibacter toxicus]